MTLEEFFRKEDAYVIHCHTEEEAIKLCNKFDEMGKHWAGGQSYRDITYWNDHDGGECYSNRRTHASYYFYRSDPVRWRVVEFNDIDDFKGGLFFPSNFQKRNSN